MCVCVCVHAFVCVLSHIGLKAISRGNHFYPVLNELLIVFHITTCIVVFL